VAPAFGLVGPGAYSLDALLGVTDLWTPAIRVTVLALGVLGGFGNLMLRHRPSHRARV
jgi:hypothetical protein